MHCFCVKRNKAERDKSGSARRVAYKLSYPYRKEKGNPRIDFPMVIMASVLLVGMYAQ